MAGREDSAGDAVAVTITTALTDPDEAIRRVRERLAAGLDAPGDAREVEVPRRPGAARVS